MNWVQQNYDRFLLAVMAAALAACAAMLFNNARNYNAVFKSLSVPVHHNENLPAEATRNANEAAVGQEEESLAKPDQWQERMINKQRLPVFVSVP